MILRFLPLLFLVIGISACHQASDKLFTKISPSSSNINFKNTLVEDDEFNVLNYPYFYNGGGVAVGDINNDGLADLFFTGNMVKNRLYLNKGQMDFEDITIKSTVADKQGWCTGATMVDINADGWLDIYVCRSADANPVKRQNLLFINNHDNTFTESAEKYGVADNGYSTHAAFFDYDKDNDLDLVVINHSQKEYMQGAQEKPGIRNLVNPDYSTHLYKNDNGHFVNVTDGSGITSNVLTFGLGLAVSDLNNDSWPDLYISNDFNEADYCFINQKNGTFREMSRDMFAYTSLFSMGNDAADINNDGLQDLITLDMLPEGNVLQKMHNGSENFNKFQILFNNGFYKQYSRNMLQLNRGDGSFDEVGQFAGISNTDWSWTPLAADFDDDGNKDIFITNGYVKDYTDMDYIKYNVDIIIEKDRAKQLEMMRKRMDKLPTIKIANYMYKNEGNVRFSNQTFSWGLSEPVISAGAAYADLDNDGDLDIIMNNSNEVASVFRNNLREIKPNTRYLNVKLVGNGMNPFAIGSKVELTTNSGIQVQELMPSKGFQSSVDYTLHFGIPPTDSIRAIKVFWSAGQVSSVVSPGSNKTISLNIKEASTDTLQNSPDLIKRLISFVDTLPFKHTENTYNDFTQQGLLPQWFSRQGPAMAKGDINGDKTEDIFIGGAKGQAGTFFLQNKAGGFIKHADQSVAGDAAYEDITAAIFDADGDGDNDLFIGSGGYELQPNDPLLQNRLYINNGNGVFTKLTGALPQDFINDNAVVAADFNNDGYIDLFNGGFCVPGKYPESSGSQLLLNDGKGHFTNQNSKWLNGFDSLNLVTAATAADINKDGQQDLVIAGHFMGIELWLNKKGHFEMDSSFVSGIGHGLYNTIISNDVDDDGDMDIIAGNQGLNNQYITSASEPMEMYYSDFDNNGTQEAVLAYYIDHKLWPIYSQDDLMQQIPSYNKRFLFYSDYAKADMKAIFGDKLNTAKHYTASAMSSVVLENNGKQFVLHELPGPAQWYPIYSITVADVNGDGKKDIITGGNQSYSRIKFGAYGCGKGDVLINIGGFDFARMAPKQAGLNISGDIRNAVLTGRKIIFGINDQQPLVFHIGE
ncbi:VCBS repeat-containing protein [Flavihumibacter fluvii]|uniref:VCBS repeat-containing protein n=1 Tax=Flavihumibacter fluvii TaxID=2838157 RepID=UPI001BDEF838|nr:VCBS repeat-containing protein [Flavihumibacter fluvii]ULQ51421.1 VCBS repeat-containing protein [Flavihumibacter fluvii]